MGEPCHSQQVLRSCCDGGLRCVAAIYIRSRVSSPPTTGPHNVRKSTPWLTSNHPWSEIHNSISPTRRRSSEPRTYHRVLVFVAARPRDGAFLILCRLGAYYAAQLGIGLKIKDTASRNVLLALLGLLEQMKSSIGHSDAIDNDAAGSAYVENFALRVFSVADNEDRSSRATR